MNTVVLLSLCIATYNRGQFIGETLESIGGQLRPGVEVVIVDGASPDETSAVVSDYASRFPAIRYFREPRNSGVDADYDKAVVYASGDYCWLMTDDDLLAPGAVARVVEAVADGATDVLLVDAEIRDRSLSRKLTGARLRFRGERTYEPGDGDAFMADCGDALSFIGATIVRRDFWMARDRAAYFGSLFVHVGVILQKPQIGRTRVIAAPLVIIRAGNSMWRPRSFDIWAFKWPELIWGFGGYGAAAKQCVTPREPWKRLVWTLYFRALGSYSRADYRGYVRDGRFRGSRLVAMLTAYCPGRLANFMGIVFLILLGRGGGHGSYELAACSPYSNPASRLLAGFWLGGRSALTR